ncbi:MAG: DUF3035 domain-containing protein [Alphaproteobacteria bacterium]
MIRTNKILIACAALLALSACSNAKKQLGLTRESPDEFAVVKRAPLALPPEYTLRPPRPGQPRPQEMSTTEEARTAVLGGPAQQLEGFTEGEIQFLDQAGAATADPSVRQKVDAETPAYAEKAKPVVQRILGTGDPEGASNVVNATEEKKRLDKNEEEGKAVTVGETPSIEQ